MFMKIRRALSRMSAGDRSLLLHMARKMSDNLSQALAVCNGCLWD